MGQGRLEPYRIGCEEMGPCRVWLAGSDTPGLSMTRAFGDAVAATVGVIAQPDITQASLWPMSPLSHIQGPADRPRAYTHQPEKFSSIST